MSNKYNNGKIYKLYCDDGHYYIGSTIQLKLNLLFNNHKCLSKNNTSRLYHHINTIGWDKVHIELVEDYPCNNKQELTKKEIEYINKYVDDFLCLNNSEEIDDDISIDNIDENDTIEHESLDTSDFESIYSNDDSNKYHDGKIYKLKCKDGHYYIGSTTTSLLKRFQCHKYSIKNNTNGGNYTYFNSVPIEDIVIELIENHPCNSKDELREKEDYYIQLSLHDPYCLNTFRAFQSDEQKKQYDKLYYTLHKDKAKENMKKYYEEHKEEIMEYHREYKEKNKDDIDNKRAEYRKQNSKMLSEKQKQYTKDNLEKVKEYKKMYDKENKEKMTEYWKEYRGKNKEKIKEYKCEWAKTNKDKKLELITKEREEKKIIREQKKQARIEHDRTITQCVCGGTYQNYQKKRHEESKKHRTYIENI